VASSLLAKHLWFAYQRVLLLQRISRAAEKSRGDYGTRVAFVLEHTGCCVADAEWSVRRQCGPSKTHRLEDAMRQAREEGFELPAAESELKAFRRLQRLNQADERARSPRAAP
jgi:hypothetical protein